MSLHLTFGISRDVFKILKLSPKWLRIPEVSRFGGGSAPGLKTAQTEKASKVRTNVRGRERGRMKPPSVGPPGGPQQLILREIKNV